MIPARITLRIIPQRRLAHPEFVAPPIAFAFAFAFVNGLVSFSVQLVFPAELATFGASVTFLFYGAAALFFFILVAVLVPETRGRNLESINEG